MNRCLVDKPLYNKYLVCRFTCLLVNFKNLVPMLLCLLFTLSTGNLFTRLLVYMSTLKPCSYVTLSFIYPVYKQLVHSSTFHSSTFSLFAILFSYLLIFYLSLHCLLKNNILLIKNQRIIFKSSLMKKIITLLVSVLLATSSFAIPAMRMWRSFKQADGTILKVMTVGDEHFNYALTEDNIPVLPHNGSYYYARIEDNQLVPSSVLAHDKALRKGKEELVAAAIQQVRQLQKQHEMHVNSKPFGEGLGMTWEGKKKGLVILVEFEDVAFRIPNDVKTLRPREKDVKTLYENMLNKVGYTNDNGAIGSVHDYFLDQSNGKFDLTFDVVGPVKLKHPHQFYGERTANMNDANAPQMIIDACNAIQGQVDFSKYDWDDDGEVEQVYVIYAGEGEATGGEPSTIWPHKYSLTDAGLDALTFNGQTINTYACSNEIIRAKVNEKSRIYYSGIGTICHEFSHCLGLPDFYDTRGGSNIGSGRYDLMCGGSYNGGPESLINVYGGTGIGTVPAGYDAYEKAYMGWLKPITLGDEAVEVKNMKGLAEGGDAYFLYNPDTKNEYYIFENRTPHRWDAELPGHGLMVFHVDFDAYSWRMNNLNAASAQRHPRFTIVSADGRLDHDTQNSDPFPTDLNNSLTKSTDPRLSFYTNYNVSSQAGVKQIVRNNDNTISFHFTPLKAATGINNLSADHEQPAETYTLSGVKVADNQNLHNQIVIVKGKKVRK